MIELKIREDLDIYENTLLGISAGLRKNEPLCPFVSFFTVFAWQ